MPKVNITSISQIKYKAEVPQVVTLFGTSYTPVASTTYKCVVYDPLRVGWLSRDSHIPYSYTTPATITDIGASAALQREYIHLQLVAAINADGGNHSTAQPLVRVTVLL